MSEEEVIKAYNILLRKYNNYNIRENIDYILFDKLKTDYYLIKFIPKGLRNKKILDIGTFIPFDPIYWGDIVKEFHSIDINKEVVAFANSIIRRELSESIIQKINYQQASSTKIPYEDNYFDVVLSFSTIDHIPLEKDRYKTFSEIARVTKKNGFVIITLPNRLNFFSYRKSMKLQKRRGCKTGVEIFYTPKELKKILEKNNLKPLVFSSSVGDKSNGIPYISWLYNKIFSKFGPRMGWLARKL